MRQRWFTVMSLLCFLPLLTAGAYAAVYQRPIPAEGEAPTTADFKLYDGASSSVTVEILNLTPWEVAFNHSWSSTSQEPMMQNTDRWTPKSFMFAPVGIPSFMFGAPEQDFGTVGMPGYSASYEDTCILHGRAKNTHAQRPQSCETEKPNPVRRVGLYGATESDIRARVETAAQEVPASCPCSGSTPSARYAAPLSMCPSVPLGLRPLRASNRRLISTYMGIEIATRSCRPISLPRRKTLTDLPWKRDARSARQLPRAPWQRITSTRDRPSDSRAEPSRENRRSESRNGPSQTALQESVVHLLPTLHPNK